MAKMEECPFCKKMFEDLSKHLEEDKECHDKAIKASEAVARWIGDVLNLWGYGWGYGHG